MNIILGLCLILPFVAMAQTKLLLIGGGARPVEAMKEFVEHSRGNNGYILVIPWASASLESAEKIKSEFTRHGAKKIDIIPHELSPEDVIQLKANIKLSTGIFFTGGNQNSLMASLKKFQLIELLREKFRQGTIMGGTSAGTAIMSDPMLNGEANLEVIDGSQVGLTEGLGLLPANVIVDQHFIVRGRFNRLAGLILDDKAKTGVAVDENTSLLILGHKARVIGPTQVLIFTKTEANSLQVKILTPQSITEL